MKIKNCCTVPSRHDAGRNPNRILPLHAWSLSLFILLLLLCGVNKNLKAQGYYQFTTDGIHDTICDKDGNKFALSDQMVNPPAGYNSSNARPLPTASCSAGYYNLFFAPGSVFTTGPNAALYQNVVCQVFTDLSNLINSPLSAPTNTVRVNIYCGNTSTASPGTIGSASSYYIFPLAPASANPGLADNTIFHAITTGIDPYSLVSTIFTSPTAYYHGVVAISPTFPFHFNLGTTAVAAGVEDLYSVVLHEATHALGFASLIDNTGASKFGAMGNYYATYDKYLTNASGVPLLSSTTPACLTGNLSFTGSATQIAPGSCTTAIPSNSTNCTQAVRFIAPGINVGVYTPNCWEAGSSLSHFEDMCSVPAGFTTACVATPPGSNNDLYYLMSNANNSGSCGVKRYLREEERTALCNLGYSVKSVNASPVAGAAYTYTGGACSGAPVIGVNDGIVNGVFTFTATTTINIPISTSILANDVSALPLTANCFSLVYNQPWVSFSVSGNQLTVSRLGSATANCGLVVLKYIPKTSTGVLGNPTYVYVYFDCPATCNPSNSCELVQNGGFESKLAPNNVGCGHWVATSTSTVLLNPNLVDCWGYNAPTSPDIFTKNCTNTQFLIGHPTPFGMYGISATYNNSPNNSTAIGVGASVGSTINEYLRNRLAAPLVPTNTYVVSFWVMNSNYIGGTNNFVVTLATAPNFTSAMGPTSSTVFPGGYNVLANFTVTGLPVGVWAKQTATVVFNSPGNAFHSGLIVGVDPVASAALPNGSTSKYAIFDDISILPIGAYVPFSLPDARCSSNSITNIAQYAGVFQSGVFSGIGVTQNGSTYDFNVPPSLPPGVYNIALTYTTASGCVNTTNAITNVSGIVTTTNAATCSSGGYTLSAGNFPAGTSYTWQPSGSTSGTIVVSPSVSTVYTLIAVSPSCTNTYTTAINIYPSPTVNPVPPLCIGSVSNYLNTYLAAGSPLGGVFSGTNIIQQSCAPPFGTCYYINLMPPVTALPGIYNYTYALAANPAQGYNCPVTTTFNVNYLNRPAPTINSIPAGNCILSGQTTTLTSGVTPSAGITYTWLPGGQNTPSIVITPTASTVYSVIVANPGCAGSASYAINPIVPYTFVNPPTQICTYQTLYNLQQYLAPGTPSTGVWSSPSGMGVFYSPSPGVTHVNVSPTITTVGTHTIAYTYTPSSSPACNISIQFTINVGQGFSLNASPSQTYCANIPGNSVVISATGSPVPPSGITYVWQPGALAGQTVSIAPPNTTNYTVTATSGFCTFTTITQVVAKDNCCVATNYITTPTLTTSTFGPGSYAINQDITITGNVNFSSAEFKLAPNVKITVQNGASLNISTAHLYSCFDMWNGIDVKGKLKIEKNSLIEDAITAVKSDQSNNLLNTPASADVFLNGSTFNRNLTAVSISNYVYNVQNGPYYISACVFTSRNLPFTATSWPNTGIVAPGLRAETTSSTALNTPYGMQNYPVANLKAPFSNIKASIGIYVERFGTASLLTNAPSPVYSSLLIGDETNNTRKNVFNLFDNLSFGIYAKNGNIKSMNNTFQNMKRSVSGTLTYGGIGIYSTHDSLIASNNVITVTHPLTLSSPALYNNLNNQFYDCFTGIRLNNIYTADLRYTDMRSTSNFALPPTNSLNVVGYQGIAIYGNRFLGHQIRNNTLRNMETGVSFYCSYGQMAIPGLASYGRYLYNVFITDNTIIPQYTLSSASTGGRVGLGVYAASSTNVLGQDLASPGYGIRVENNLLHNVWRGVEFNGWKNGGYRAIASTNTITLVQDINPVMQYGVKVTDCRDNAVTTNSITGYNLTNTLVTGVYSSLNANGQIECNNVNRLFAGFEFAGIQPGTSWKYNLLQNNKRGLKMTNNAQLGQQGSYNAPSDNQWLGTWTVNDLNTWTDSSSFAANSKLALRTSTGYYPAFNTGQVQFNSFFNTSNLIFANNSAASFNCASLSSGGGGNGGGSGTAAAMTLLNDVASDNTTYTVNATQTEEINKNLVFEEVVKDPALALNSSTLATFYNDNLTTTRGLYKEVEQKLGTGDLNGADAKINSISPSTNIEYNYKLYYELERKYSEWLSLDNADLSTLQVLCYQCPFIDGAIVYKARSLYNMVQNTNVQYHDYNCVVDGFSFSRAGTGNTVSALETALLANEQAMKARFGERVNYNLYPNPANDQFYIGSSKKAQVLMMCITDGQGRVLLKDKINIQNFNALIQTDLQNGIYFVTLVEENGQKTTKKLIIAK